jgi:hypothetical protein
MFENLRVLETTTHSVVSAQDEGNPFVIRAVVGVSDDQFLGASFVEVLRGDRVIPAHAFCSAYGMEHSYTGEDADALTELCQIMNRDLEERYHVTFLVRDPAPEMEDGPQPPVEDEPQQEEES